MKNILAAAALILAIVTGCATLSRAPVRHNKTPPSTSHSDADIYAYWPGSTPSGVKKDHKPIANPPDYYAYQPLTVTAGPKEVVSSKVAAPEPDMYAYQPLSEPFDENFGATPNHWFLRRLWERLSGHK
jgi:hypothetical protein